MKNFLQMLHEFVLKKGLGFEKYLVAFCILISVQYDAFAQYTFLQTPVGTKYIVEGIANVNPGDDLTLTVPFAPDGTEVTWEYRTAPGQPRQTLVGENGTTLTVSNIQEDIEYIATYNGGWGASSARILIACASLVSNRTTACPNDQIVFDLKGGRFADLGKYEQKTDGPAWRPKQEFSSTNFKDQWILSEISSSFSFRVSFEYGSYYGGRSVKAFSTNEINVTLSNDCKAECMQTSTGDYYVGTDFDPAKEDGPYHKVPEDVEQHFGDYDIDFNGTPGFEPRKEGQTSGGYWLGTNTQEFFGQTPALDANLESGTNHYLFCENPNSNIVSLKFNGSDVWGKTYQYKMRLYLQMSHECQKSAENAWANAKFIPRTGHGKASTDYVRATAYDNQNNKLKEAVVRDNQTSEGWIVFGDILDFSKIEKNTLVRIEIEFFGSFPDNHAYKVFTFEPRFEQFECGKVALDYISAEIENVCLSPKVLCEGEYTTAHAAGFPMDAVYRWYRKDGDNWVEDESNYNVQNASFQAKKGVTQYQLRVSSSLYTEERVHDFSVAGIDCHPNKPSKINGGTFCMPNTQSYRPDIVDHSDNITFEWSMYNLDETLWFDSKTKSDPHFQVLTSKEYTDPLSEYYTTKAKNDSLVIILTDDDTTLVKEGDYKMELRVMRGTVVDTVLDSLIHIYRRPDITLKLLGDKFSDETSESNKTLCPSDRRREIIAFAQNSFTSPMMENYVYSWISNPGTPSVFSPLKDDPSKAVVNLDAIPGICSGDLDKVEFSVFASIDVCKSSDKNDYDVEKSDDPTIDCSSLEKSNRDTFWLPVKAKTMVIRIPIPDFTSGCDSDPKFTIDYKPILSGNPDLVNPEVGSEYSGNIIIYKSELATSPLLNVDLPWGMYDFKYSVTDGCGKEDSCNANIVIKKDWGPVVDCDSIKDLVGKSEGEKEGCVVIYDNTELEAPVLWDENDLVHVTGVYAGRRHFDSKQEKSTLIGNDELLAKFDSKNVQLYDPYEIDYTYILWKFTNNANKSSYCVQEVYIRDTIKPYFDCGTIDPFEFRPETKPGECSIDFKDFWNELKAKNYTAYDSCPLPITAILGELHEDSILIDKVSNDRTFFVGIADTIYWQFRDRHDNVKYCPQSINAKSVDSVKIKCSDFDYVEGTAEPGECFANAAKLNIPSPVGYEPCTDENGDSIPVPGVGTRRDGMALNDPYPTGYTYIDWIFVGKNSKPSRCVTTVFVKGNRHFNLDCDVLFPKRVIEIPECDSTRVLLEPKKVADPCVAGYMAESVPYFTQYVNNSDGTIDTMYTLIDLKTENPYKFPKVGEWFVSWVFTDFTGAISDTCVQSIHLKDTFPPVFPCENIPDTMLVEIKGSCTISYEDLRPQLGTYFATEVCTGDLIEGVPYLLDTITGVRSEIPALMTVGKYTIVWVFANDSLTTAEKICIKTLDLRSDFAPPFDCSTLKTITLIDSVGLCVVPVDSTLVPIPQTHDYCKIDYPVYGHGYIQIDGQGKYVDFAYFDRTLNKSVYLMSVPFGKHNVKWVFESIYSTKTSECTQVLIAHSDALDKYNCDDLASYVSLEYKGSAAGATFEELVAVGLKEPVLDDPCNVLVKEYTRSDNADVYKDLYLVGKITDIKWLVKDTTKSYPREKECHTKVEVSNGDIGVVECPDMPGTFLCEDAVPAPYATYQEFLNNGGTVVSRGEDVSGFINPASFSVTTTIDGDGRCDYYLIRTYHVNDYREQSASCSQSIHIKDDQGPIWDKGASTTQTFNCVAVDFFPTDLSATDACVNTKYTEYKKVKEFSKDLKDGLFYIGTTTKSDDPSSCDYYTYKETRRYVAYDVCSNPSSELIYESYVQDTFSPILNIPDWWKDSMFVANYGVPCVFTVPDLTTTLPDDAFDDVCDPSTVKYFTITQIPVAGSYFDPTKGTQDVTLIITDPCGNSSRTSHPVYVPTRKEVISEYMNSITVCAEKELLLKSSLISGHTGRVWTYNRYTRTWSWQSTDKVVYDYYRGEVAPENIIFSNNPKTYGKMFDSRAEADSIVLNDTSKTGKYSIVVMDTIRYCSDTASAYLTVHASPFIHLEAGSMQVCERDSIHLESEDETLYDKYKVDVDSVGEKILAEGWMLDTSIYKPMTKLPYSAKTQKLYYYATNVCGTGYSTDSIDIHTQMRMVPENLMLVTDPQDKPRVILGENASLQLVTKYKPKEYRWMRVRGAVDGRYDEMFDKEGNVREEYKQFLDEDDENLGSSFENEPDNKKITLYALGDTASYYVLLIDSVCPAVPSNVVAIDVVKQIPTAFTPHNSIGMNDIFMEGHKVIIFNRYGLKMVESDNGWDGTSRGTLVDPGVYFYEVIINEGQKVKGSIEVVYFK